MKRLLVLFILSLTAVGYSQNLDYACGWYGSKTVEERNGLFPFNKTKKVILISYSNYEFGDSLYTKEPELFSIKKAREYNPDIISKFVFLSDSYRTAVYFSIEEQELNADGMNELSHILCNYMVKPGDEDKKMFSMNTMCYTPRNSILFFDENNKIICCYEICFECMGSGMWPDPEGMNDIAQIEGCLNRYEIIKDFFKRNGITYGTKSRR